MPNTKEKPRTRGHALVVGNIRYPKEALVDAGYRVTWLTKRELSIVPEWDDVRRCTQIFLVDPKMDEARVLALVDQIDAADPIDVICSFHDEGQVLATVIAERLGKPFVLERDTILNARDKWRMRRCLESAGLRSVHAARVERQEDLTGFFEEAGPHTVRAVLKPLSGTGSEGVRFVSREEAMAGGVSLDGAGSWLVEAFVEGPEYSVEGFSLDGRHHIVAVTEKFKHPGTFMESGHLVPARLGDEDRQAVAGYVSACLDALSFTMGASHSEIILGAEGPVMIETHTRLGGDRIADLVRLALGVDLYRVLGKSAIGEDIGEEELTPSKSGVWACSLYTVQDRTGLIEAVEGVDAAKAMDGIFFAGATFEAGSVLPAVKHSFDRCANAVATGGSPGEALRRAEAALGEIAYRLAGFPPGERAGEG